MHDGRTPDPQILAGEQTMLFFGEPRRVHMADHREQRQRLSGMRHHPTIRLGHAACTNAQAARTQVQMAYRLFIDIDGFYRDRATCREDWLTAVRSRRAT